MKSTPAARRTRRRQLYNLIAVACACIQGGWQVVAFALPDKRKRPGRKKGTK